jgi:hypothetical protein
MVKWMSGPIAVALLLAAGCRSSLPKTYIVSGSVRYQGGQPMKGGSVQFAAPTDPALRIVGLIRADGTFTLETIRDNDKTSGAPEGDYEVTVFPPLRGDHKGTPALVLPTRYKVAAGEKNEFTIDLTVLPPS